MAYGSVNSRLDFGLIVSTALNKATYWAVLLAVFGFIGMVFDMLYYERSLWFLEVVEI